MARKRQSDEGGGESSWLNTYADMITLVLTFFIALFSMSTLQQEKFTAFVEGLGIELTSSDQMSPPESHAEDPEVNPSKSEVDIENTKPENFEEIYEFVKAYVEQNNMETSVEVSKGDDVVYIRFSNSVFFGPDSYQLKQDGLPMLDFLGSCFKEVESELMMINIYGHTASVDDPYYPVNSLMLSSERAANVAIFFQSKKDIDGKILNPIGQGNSFPVADNGTSEGREKNRRVEMAIVSNKATITDTQDVLRLLQGTFNSDQYPAEGSVEDILGIKNPSQNPVKQELDAQNHADPENVVSQAPTVSGE